jgi:uncharacterized integral membrane protein (TIGR00697 family)
MKYKYYDIIMALFVAVLLISNIASTKITTIWKFTFDAGTLLFPLSYIFGDVLTEVYGYARARRVIWVGFFSAGLLSITLIAASAMPSAADWPHQEAFMSILGLAPRIVLASLIAYLAGEFSNSYILAKMKILSKGKKLWLRTISSTLAGQIIDTVLFVVIAFYGLLPNNVLLAVIISNYIIKCSLEIILTPATYKAVNFLKKEEGIDYYDKQTNFNPFSLKTTK